MFDDVRERFLDDPKCGELNGRWKVARARFIQCEIDSDLVGLRVVCDVPLKSHGQAVIVQHP